VGELHRELRIEWSRNLEILFLEPMSTTYYDTGVQLLKFLLIEEYQISAE